jgi:serine/threonine protein kinase
MEKIRENDVIKIEVIYVVQGIVEVSKVRHIRSNEIMCMKKIFVKDVQAASSFQSEFITMASLKHPNILKLRSVILSGSGNMIEYILIFCDFCEEGDLDAFIVKTMNRRAFLPEQTIFNYLKQIISALSYMESHQIAHRDIKPQNIFLTDGGSTLKLGDFGSAAKETSFQYKTLTGTPLYLSPALRREFSMMMMNGVDHNLFKSDVYSLGLTFLYMASLQPVTDLTALNGLEDRIELRIKALPSQYPLVKEILYEMLRFDEKTRPSFSELEIIIDKLTTPRIKGILKSNQKFNNFIFVDSLFGCCGICKKECQESKVYVFNAGLLCFECFEFYQNQRRSRVNQFKM